MNDIARICLIEDDAIMGESLCDRFELEGLVFDWWRTGTEARQALTTRPYAVVISDIRLPDMGGDELYMELLGQYGPGVLPSWLFITGYGAVDRAVDLLKAGATDYITKPFDLDALVDKLTQLLTPLQRSQEGVTRLGVSAAMRRIEALLPRLASQANTILITGESGVGKEVVAREIHHLAHPDGQAPFVAVNCGALSEGLLEAELFGHEKGAFTGALRARAGVFEQANGGTLFLDEVGDMPLAMQVKLLRAIQDRKVVRVGGEQAIPVNLRLICATHRDLREMVDEGSFREDLFYRIHVIQLRIPPLRERREDIIWLAQAMLQEHCKDHPGEVRRFSPQVEQALLRHPWPGNIRELKHALERACILSSGNALMLDTLFESSLPEASVAEQEENLAAYLRQCEQGYIRDALERHEGRIAETANSLGISRKNLWERMKRLGIET